jgi:hypothetical protein
MAPLPQFSHRFNIQKIDDQEVIPEYMQKTTGSVKEEKINFI